jgi:hypothetical protein
MAANENEMKWRNGESRAKMAKKAAWLMKIIKIMAKINNQ